MIVALLDDPKLHATQATQAGQFAGFSGRQSGVDWVKRFNVEGIAGLQDKPKAGRPLTHPNDALDYWNQHCHPYSWKKRPQEQFTLLGGFGIQLRSDNLAI